MKEKPTFKWFVKWIFVGKDSLESKIKQNIKNKTIAAFLKILLLPLVSFFSFFLIPILILITILFIFIYTVNQSQLGYMEEENKIFNNKPLTSGGTIVFNSSQSLSDAGNFDSFSSIPHWIPITGKFIQKFCSNFYWTAKGRIGYAWHPDRNLQWEKECQERMKKDPLFKNFNMYTGGDWSKIGAHWGIDIAADEKTNVYSMSYWTVVSVRTGSPHPIWGYYIDIKSDNWRGGYYLIRYAHLSKPLVKIKDTVYAWQLIALSWNTGASSGPHLHVSICENGDIYSLCYRNKKDSNMLDPLPFMLNYVYNGEGVVKIENENKLIGTRFYAWTWKPGLILLNSDFKNIDMNSPLTRELALNIIIKVGKEENIHPLLIKAIYKTEGGEALKNPKPTKGRDGRSWLNEGVYGIYDDFRNLTPYCIRSEENFWKIDWSLLTLREFKNQTICAATVLKHKTWGSSFITPKELNIENDEGKEKLCKLLSRYNYWSFYCWNNLYPLYSNNPKYKDMPVYVKGKFIWNHKADGILKIMLDQWNTFKELLKKDEKE